MLGCDLKNKFGHLYCMHKLWTQMMCTCQVKYINKYINIIITCNPFYLSCN